MQTRIVSLIGMITGKIIGFVVAVMTQIIVLPWFFDAQIDVTQNIKIAAIFTVVASVKSYGVRRLFNWLELIWLHPTMDEKEHG